MFENTPESPFVLFHEWYNLARETDPANFNAMNIATVSKEGTPSSRIVLLKDFSDSGLIFFTNYNSRKGKDLSDNPHIAVNFWWKELERQVRFEGPVQKLSAAESNNYFGSRPRLSRIASITSQQSSPVESIEKLERSFQENIEYYNSHELKRPDHWGGFCISPVRIEFWQGMEHRLHHRLLYELDSKTGKWSKQFLQP